MGNIGLAELLLIGLIMLVPVAVIVTVVAIVLLTRGKKRPPAA